MAGLTKQFSEWLRRVENVLSKRETVSVELRDDGVVREVRDWRSIAAFLANHEVEEEAIKLATLDRLSRQPRREAPAPETRAAALIAEREMLVQSARQLLGTAFELSAIISALEKDLPPRPALKKHAKRKQIAKRLAELEAVCNRPHLTYVDGFKAA